MSMMLQMLAGSPPAAGGGLPTGDLIAYWRMEEETGNRVSQVGTHPLVPQGTMTFGTGKLGTNAARRSTTGAGNYLSLGSRLTSGAVTQLSVFAWAYYDGAMGTNASITVAGEWATSNAAWRFHWIDLGAGDLLRITLSDDGTNADKDYRYALTGNAPFKFVGFTYNAGTLKVYVDGSEVTTDKTADGTCNALYDGTASFDCFSALAGTSGAVTGYIDEVSVWTTELSAANVTELYNSGTGLDPTA